MKLLRITSLFLCSLGMTCLSHAKMDLIPLLDENSWMVMEVRDLDKLKKQVSEHELDEPISKLINKMKDFSTWNDGEEPETDEDKLIAETMKEFIEKIEGLVSQINGQVVFSVGGDLTQMMMAQQAGEDVMPTVSLLAHSKISEEELDEFFEWIIEKDEEIESDREEPIFEVKEVSGTKLYLFTDYIPSLGEEESDSLATFISNGVWGMTIGEENAVNLLQHIEEGSKSDNIQEIYEDAFEYIEQGDLNLLLNANSLTDFFDFLKTNKKTQFPENPMKVTTKSILDGLSLDSLQTLSMSMKMTEDGGVMYSALNLKDRNGLWKLLDLYKEHAALPKFIPDGIFSATYAGFEMGQLWPTVDNILLNISPLLKGMVDFQIQVLENTHKINIREDLLGSLGGEVCTFSRLPTLNPDDSIEEQFASRDVHAIKLKNSDRFERTLVQLLKSFLADKLKVRQQKGIDVHYMSYLENYYISFAITQQWLVVSTGKPSDMNQVLDHLSDPPTENLWSNPQVQAVLQDAPSQIIQWDYVDLENMMQTIGKGLEETMKLLPGGDEPSFWKELPQLPYFVIGWSKETKNGMISKALLLKKDK